MTRRSRRMSYSAGLFLLLWQPFSVLCQSDLSIVNRSRPLAGAAEALEHKYGVLINYEDPPYTFTGDVVDLTARGAVAQRPGAAHILVPKPGSLTVPITVAVTNGRMRTADAASMLSTLLTAYHASESPGHFGVLQNGDVFTIVPISIRGSSGVSQTVTPILDTRINIPEQRTTALKAIELVCYAINGQSGAQTVEVGTIPTNILLQRTIDLSASNEPARNVLERIVSTAEQGDTQARRHLVWDLLYGPDLNKYVLNLHIAAQERAEPTGKEKKLIPIP